MHTNKGYLCENCGESIAKYEARLIKSKNILVCSDCLKIINPILGTNKTDTSNVNSPSHWTNQADQQKPFYPSF